ncbi:hypothetical protein D3C71_1483730 [compost metagenome]
MQAFWIAYGAAHGKARAHGVAHQVIGIDAHGLGECADVIGAGVGAVIQFRSGGGQAAATCVEYVGIEMLAQALGDKPPGDRRAGDAGYQQHYRFAGAALTAITQVVLADTIGLNVAALNEGAHAATSDFSGWP